MFFWHLPRAGPSRPWEDDAKTQQGDASPRGPGTPHHSSNLWHRRGSVPLEQHEGWERTKTKIDVVVKEMADLGLDILHDTLEVAVDALEFVPVVGLAEAARTLLTIWDAVQMVEFNRLACLRLTERCANMLLAIKQEIQEADQLGAQASSSTPKLGSQLKELEKGLPDAFRQVHQFLERLARRPFLKRYLKRDEIQRELAACHTALNDAFDVFSLSVQIRIFEQVLQAEQQRQEDNSRLFEQILHTPPFQGTPLPPYQSPHTPTSQFVSSPISEQGPVGGYTAEPESNPAVHTPSGELDSLGLNLGPFLSGLTEWQNVHDALHDLADLRMMMRRALERNDDAEMIQLLQVKPEDAPEALKALQRALEDEVARERTLAAQAQEEGTGELVQDDSIASMQAMMDGSLSRKQTVDAPLSRSSSSSHAASDKAPASDRTATTGSSHDTLDREFMESGIDSLLRLSVASGTTPASLSLPAWTITRYEVDLEESVGQGFFSQVWKGRYRNRVVAVKVLASWTPKETFLREVHVWNELRHKNILEMVGASAVEATPMTIGWDSSLTQLPWFIVSRCYERGSLVKWVKGLAKEQWESMVVDASQGVLRMIHEIVQGMQYLHTREVLHGDLKAANVLINKYGHCIISDFGQSELRSEAYRLSGTPLPHGTLRWQAPELMAGQSKLTTEVDVYAFAITCIEILTKGGVPWPLADDNAVRNFVSVENMRPEIPPLAQWSPHLAEIIRQCWAWDPSLRPSFAQLNKMMFTLRLKFGWNGRDDLLPGEAEEEQDWIDWIDELDREHKSPAMNPDVLLPPLAPGVCEVDVPSFSNETTPQFAYEVPGMNVPLPPSMASSMSMPLPGTSSGLPPTAVVGAQSAPVQGSAAPTVVIPSGPQSRQSSLVPSSSESERWSVAHDVVTPPRDERAVMFRNERRYRITLQHEFHPSLSLPLWSPSPVALGSVGYYNKPSGSFVTLFNAFNPADSTDRRLVGIPSLNGYGSSPVKHTPKEKRNAMMRKFDQFTDWLSRGKQDTNERSISRRYSTPLRNGHKSAYLFTESTMYNYIADPELAAPRKWFNATFHRILEIYGTERSIQKEDLMLVIGTLDAPEYAMFVSHTHPDGQVNFNVFTGSQVGQKWGEFSTSTDLAMAAPDGPAYKEEVPLADFWPRISKVKEPGEPWDTVLIARLRFPTDKDEATIL
ncbi:hypothetical protein PHLGIDRAFT_106442 [Phlebiopsis gigantea 11061_1 CR5-6]|uniref:Protein kinase domain-containing protein n=1 Tax=Phlebiopsis gigantea (strain 11061_1 CR5-6) TaxID=745531 RepID=A0A0C3RY19_PHLG1|nr:hypothetical protein PHLGIDRAFT_106442 [Phlebiopsis gigantea 11061_1 CR5-6]